MSHVEEVGKHRQLAPQLCLKYSFNDTTLPGVMVRDPVINFATSDSLNTAFSKKKINRNYTKGENLTDI